MKLCILIFRVKKIELGLQQKFSAATKSKNKIFGCCTAHLIIKPYKPAFFKGACRKRLTC